MEEVSLAPEGQVWCAKTYSDTLRNVELGVGANYKRVAFLVSLGEEDFSRSQQVVWQVALLQPWGPL